MHELTDPGCQRPVPPLRQIGFSSLFWADFKDEEGKTRVSSLFRADIKDEEAKTRVSSLNSGENKDEEAKTRVCHPQTRAHTRMD